MTKPTSAAAVRERLNGALMVGTGRSSSAADPPSSEGTIAEPVPEVASEPVASTAGRELTRRRRPERLVRVTVDLDPDVHQAVRVRLAEGGVTLAAVVRELLRRYDEDADLRGDVLGAVYRASA